ncbi:hypothetical protein ASC77_09460 [Nocardioides sp. Root1257]|uniref:phage late control D family protein n=1 Tax=unclassified Nocardioides TaxID=2615069 RepID=UPI0006F7140D|nr:MULTISPECIES: contractile injection system protein, VgrG/Pvc8 family [unclassified Nocardioides]KQW48934.1 hypothetical protein ASC77_09460 [Nocardioides sp. Root1257]KRC48109.1 hypothetical protein ASE24_09465 [Nocardioides sp. Root224]
MPDTLLYASTPALRVGGSLATGPMQHLVSLTVEEDVHGLCWMEARLNNWGFTGNGIDYLYLDRATFDFGTRVEVSFGPNGGTRVFTGRISALEAAYPAGSLATFGICAEDGLQDLRLSRRTRTFDQVSTADVAQQLASDHGLTADISLTGPTRVVVNQLNLSDLAFLRQLALADGGEVWLDDSTLHVQGRADRDGGSVSLEYGGGLLHFDVRADLAHQVTDVVATGWSVADKDTIEETADSGGLGAELGSDSSGSDVLAAAFAERHEHLVVTEPLTSDDARSRAKAAYLERARRFVTGSGRTGGTPELRVGGRVTLSGLGSSFNGDYRVVRTRHHFDVHDGYRTDFDVERAGIGATS